MKRIVLALLALSLTGCANVGTGYRGVVINWNRPTGEVKQEGIYPVVPFTGYEIIPMNVQVVADEIKTSAASKDLQSVQATVTVNFHLDPNKVVQVYDRLRQDYEIRVLNPTVHEAVKASTARFVANDLIAHRNEVRDAIDRNLRGQMTSYGIVVDQVLITDFSFDKTFQDAVEQKVAAQQNLITAGIEAQTAKAKALGQAQAQQAQKQTLTALILQKEMIDKWNGQLPQVTGGNNPFISLNLLRMPSENK